MITFAPVILNLKNVPNQTVEIVQLPASLSGEDVLPGFVLDLPVFWEDFNDWYDL